LIFARSVLRKVRLHHQSTSASVKRAPYLGRLLALIDWGFPVCGSKCGPAGSDVNSGGQYTNNSLVSADGTFRVVQLKPGRYEVRVIGTRSDRSSVEVMKQPVNVLASEDVTNLVLTVPADFAYDSGVALRGMAHFPDGKPAANANSS